jgi:hypothetical protein
MPIPERLRPIVDSVTADTSDAEIARLAGADGRLLTTLYWQRDRLRDPFFDRLDAAERAYEDAHVALQHAQQGGDMLEIEEAEHVWLRSTRALREMIDKMLDEHEATLPSATIIPFRRRDVRS